MLVINIDTYDSFKIQRLPKSINIPKDEIYRTIKEMNYYKTSFFKLENHGIGLFSKYGRTLPFIDETFVIYSNYDKVGDIEKITKAFMMFGFKNVSSLYCGIEKWKNCNLVVEEGNDFPIREYGSVNIKHENNSSPRVCTVS